MARLSTIARFDVSGEILSEDTLALLSAPVCRIPGAEMNDGDFAAAYDLLIGHWQFVRNEVANYDTERLRRRWQLLVLDILDFRPEFLKSHTTYGERYTIPLTHRSGNIPIWLLGYGEDFDAKPQEGKRRRSPHELFQEYLDLTDDEWGILFSGKSIRLLHDYHKSLTRNYVEADLESTFDALDVDAFRAVWRVFHASRFAKDGKGECPIAKLRDFSRQDGASVGKELRLQVRKAIEVLGNGFLSADQEGVLSQALRDSPGAVMGYYQALLKVVYRILFLLYIENRPNWTPAQNPVWADSYSITRLREMAEENDFSRANGEDLWEGLNVVARIIREGSEFFGIHPYGGELFDDDKLGPLKDAALANSDLLAAIRLLTMFERDRQVYRVNFGSLDIEAMGSVYEGLLDATAVITPDGSFGFAEGTERKLTGSYYTPKELVAELIKSALVPVIEDRLAGKTTAKEKEDALKSIKVVDPACGSGAFLIQALEKLAEKLVEIRLGGEEPSDLEIREAKRDVVRHCIHGVDLNPLAVDLCRFDLWLKVAHPSFPLSYLEPLIKCGNSLVGVPLPSQVEQKKAEVEKEKRRLVDLGDHKAAGKVAYVGWPDSIPDDAFNPVSGDDPKTARAAKKHNAEQLGGQLTTDAAGSDTPGKLADYYGKLRTRGDATVEEVHQAELLYRTYTGSDEYCRHKAAADLWCAAFFWRHEAGQKYVPTNQWLKLARRQSHSVPDEIWNQVHRMQDRVRFFHWYLEFPDVFKAGGFDCVLGNPPWERIKLEEREFFLSRCPDIAVVANKTSRQALIDQLAREKPDLIQELEEAKHTADSDSRFVRASWRFPLTTTGDVNTYALFAELSAGMRSSSGSAGIICPTGIATDDSTKRFFGLIWSSAQVVSLYDFENREGIFPDVAPVQKFCLLTLSSVRSRGDTQLAFFLTKIAHLTDDGRVFTLNAGDLSLLNPNTSNCPVFRTRPDALLTRSIYRSVPVLVDEAARSDPWLIQFSRLFDMTNDSGLFGRQRSADSLPLYEAKFIQQFDHRHGSYEGISDEARFGTRAGTTTPSLVQKASADYAIEPRYWVSRPEVVDRLQGKWGYDWLLAFRDIVRSTCDQRVCVFSITPLVAVGNTAPLLLLGTLARSHRIGAFLANANCLVFDYVTRQKLASTHMNFFVVKQLPFLPPLAYSHKHTLALAPLIAELVYTAWDIKAFADDVWNDVDDELKLAIKEQWEDNKASTGGHEWNPPDWAEIDEDGIPLPPFKWDDNRRAVLKAELDAYYARLYGLTRKQLRYILDPHGLSHKELQDILDPWEDPTCSGPHLLPAEPAEGFPGETFRVLKDKEEKQFGEYRTRRLVLEAWAKLETELGPVQPVNYREMLEHERREKQLVEQQSVEVARSQKQQEPSDLVLRSPDYSDQTKLKFDTPASVSKTEPRKPVPAHVKPEGKRVLINSQPATLVSEEPRDGKTKVFVLIDGEREPRSFYVPPARMEHEE